MTDEQPRTLILPLFGDNGAAIPTCGEESELYMPPRLSANPAVLVADAGRAMGLLLVRAWGATYGVLVGGALSSLGSAMALTEVRRKPPDYPDTLNCNVFH